MASINSSCVRVIGLQLVAAAQAGDGVLEIALVQQQFAASRQRRCVVGILGQRGADLLQQVVALVEPFEHVHALRNDRSLIANQIARDRAGARFRAGHDATRRKRR